jgi:hypothetical protein
MFRHALALAALGCATAASGCGGEDPPSRGPEQTIHAWISAVNAGVWHRACALSVWPDDAPLACEEAMRDGFRGRRPMTLVGIPNPRDERHRFGVSTPPPAHAPTSGWTAYKATEYELEKHDGEYRVQFEVQVIR